MQLEFRHSLNLEKVPVALKSKEKVRTDSRISSAHCNDMTCSNMTCSSRCSKEMVRTAMGSTLEKIPAGP